MVLDNLKRAWKPAAKLVGMISLSTGLAGCSVFDSLPQFNSYAPNHGPNDPNPVIDTCVTRDANTSYLYKDGTRVYIQLNDGGGDLAILFPDAQVLVRVSPGREQVILPALPNQDRVGLPVPQDELKRRAMTVTLQLLPYAQAVVEGSYQFPHECDDKVRGREPKRSGRYYTTTSENGSPFVSRWDRPPVSPPPYGY